MVFTVQLDPQEIEQAELSFPCVLIKASSSETPQPHQIITIQITVPHYKNNEEKESNQADYQNYISVGIVLGISSKKKENEQVTLKELVVTSSAQNETEDVGAATLLFLSDENCQVLQRMYEDILIQASETGDDDNYLSFSLTPTSSAPDSSLLLSTNGALFTLIVQMMTDATDAQLSETLIAHQITNSSSSSAQISHKHNKNQHLMKKMDTALTATATTSFSNNDNNNNGFGKNNSSNSNSTSSTPVQSPNQSKPGNNIDFPLQSIKNNLNGNSIPTSLNNKDVSSMMTTRGVSTSEIANNCNNNNNNNNVPLAIRNSLANSNHYNLTKFLRVRICKIDHMRNEKMYLGNISENFEILKVDPIATYFENEGLLGVMTISDPNSPRVLLCLISLVLMSNQNNNNNSNILFNVSSSSSNNNNNNESSVAIQCCGSQLIKELRLNVTDVDSHGRKCRERMMRDLGAWNIIINNNNIQENNFNNNSFGTSSTTSSASNFFCNNSNVAHGAAASSSPPSSVNVKLVSEYYKMFWSSEPFKKMTPSSREEGISIIKKFFVEPFTIVVSNSVSANNNNNNFAYVANDILHDKNLWDHV